MEKMCEHDWKIVSLSEQNQEKVQFRLRSARKNGKRWIYSGYTKSTNIANDTAGANSLPVDGLCGTL